MAESKSEKIKVCFDLDKELVSVVDALKQQYGCNSRGRAIEMLLRDLLQSDS